MFLFDRYPGGLGFAEQGWARLDELAARSLEHLQSCECESGCPSCVGLPILRPAQQQDPDLSQRRVMPGKEAARVLLEHWLTRAADGAAEAPEAPETDGGDSGADGDGGPGRPGGGRARPA